MLRAERGSPDRALAGARVSRGRASDGLTPTSETGSVRRIARALQPVLRGARSSSTVYYPGINGAAFTRCALHGPAMAHPSSSTLCKRRATLGRSASIPSCSRSEEEGSDRRKMDPEAPRRRSGLGPGDRDAAARVFRRGRPLVGAAARAARNLPASRCRTACRDGTTSGHAPAVSASFPCATAVAAPVPCATAVARGPAGPTGAIRPIGPTAARRAPVEEDALGEVVSRIWAGEVPLLAPSPRRCRESSTSSDAATTVIQDAGHHDSR